VSGERRVAPVALMIPYRAFALFAGLFRAVIDPLHAPSPATSSNTVLATLPSPGPPWSPSHLPITVNSLCVSMSMCADVFTPPFTPWFTPIFAPRLNRTSLVARSDLLATSLAMVESRNARLADEVQVTDCTAPAEQYQQYRYISSGWPVCLEPCTGISVQTSVFLSSNRGPGAALASWSGCWHPCAGHVPLLCGVML
jgi:hypothetical protein